MIGRRPTTMEGSLTIWLAIAVMTAAAIFAVLLPLSRPVAAAASEMDVAVYKDQLAEIGRDADAGLIGAAEAEAARIEVSRRLIAASERIAATAGEGAARRRRLVAVGAIVIIPAIAALAYGTRGHPGYAGQPLAERQRAMPVPSDMAGLMARIEAHLAANPGDGRGWEVVAPVYLRLGRIPDAVRARANALRILGPTADREADLAEAQTLSAGGVVTAEAKAGFERALALGAGHPKAGYFIGLAAEQDGKPEEARTIWAKLVAEAPAGAPWIALLQAEIARYVARRESLDPQSFAADFRATALASAGPARESYLAAWGKGGGALGSVTTETRITARVLAVEIIEPGVALADVAITRQDASGPLSGPTQRRVRLAFTVSDRALAPRDRLSNPLGLIVSAYQDG